ncbi:MAG: ABC transporter ATP-binding protein [Candidatus Geothermarchaeales archaeon]
MMTLNPDALEKASSPIQPAPTEAAILLRDVSKAYDVGTVKVHALRRVTLSVSSGEFVVLLGPSGSGKTTLLNLVGGIDFPTEGQVYVDGANLGILDERGLTAFRREKVGFVFQFFNLIPTLTARENVEVAAHLVLKSLTPEDVLHKVGLGQRMDHFPSELSGGEQQRVAIARALAKRPPLLLCDEPTGELDYETGKSILALLRQLNREEGITVMLVTHNSAVGAMADRAVYLRSGEIARVEEVEHPAAPESLRW